MYQQRLLRAKQIVSMAAPLQATQKQSEHCVARMMMSTVSIVHKPSGTESCTQYRPVQLSFYFEMCLHLRQIE